MVCMARVNVQKLTQKLIILEDYLYDAAQLEWLELGFDSLIRPSTV